ncbi:MAG: helix-turn-helix domain-containing protein [Clostridia bacterium]|nr:helix-turn-helix domain-containing protein [Clostridia bacterium]
MAKELFSLAERIKMLREKSGLTQTALAKDLGLTRSGVNSWEMGLSVPSTAYIVELAKCFDISTDYLLGMEKTASVPIDGLSAKQVGVLMEIIQCFQTDNKREYA